MRYYGKAPEPNRCGLTIVITLVTETLPSELGAWWSKRDKRRRIQGLMANSLRRPVQARRPLFAPLQKTLFAHPPPLSAFIIKMRAVNLSMGRPGSQNKCSYVKLCGGDQRNYVAPGISM